MRTTFLLLSTLTLCGRAHAQTPANGGTNPLDVGAIMILDKMAEIIGDLHSVSFHLSTSRDVMDPEVGVLVKQVGEHDMRMVGPDKMLVDSKGDKGHRGYWCDSSGVVFYSYTENNYGMMPAGKNLITTIDSLQKAYGVDIPAADFFSPTFTDDLIAKSERITFLGVSRVNGVDCFHIIATGKVRDTELWISNDAMFQPVKYVFRNKAASGGGEVEGTFSAWEMNPDLPHTLFTFMPPPSAREVRILSRHD